MARKRLVLAAALMVTSLTVCGRPVRDDEPVTFPQSGGPAPSLFGVFELPPENVPTWSFTVTRANDRKLEQYRDAGVKVLVALTGGRPKYSNAQGCFDLQKWKQALDAHDVARIGAFVDDGTIAGLYAMDEPHDWRCGPSYADIDAACAYAHGRWPKMRCGVNAPPAWLARGRAQLRNLDYLFFQYSTAKGDPHDWLVQQKRDTAWFQGEIWLSIQVLQPRMSPADLQRVSQLFCAANARGVLMWKWSPEYFGDPAVRQALTRSAGICAQAEVAPGSGAH